MPPSAWSDKVRELRLPETPDTILRAAMQLKAAGRLKEALDGLEEVLRRDEKNSQAMREAATALRQLGRRREAEAMDQRRRTAEADELFELALQRKQDDEGIARQYLAECAALAETHDGLPFAAAVLGDSAPPDRAPDRVTAMLNDRRASRYDWYSRTVLRRRTPDLLFEAVQAVADTAISGAIMADIGCGTGLGAEPYADIAARIDGVDLSPRMAERAFRRRADDDSRKQLYAQLDLGEFAAWLWDRPLHFDLVLGCDAFTETGDLIPVFTAVAQALQPGGLFAFSYEHTEAADYDLSPRQAYRHNPFAVRRALAATNLDAVQHRHAVLWHDDTQGVMGGIVVARRAAAV